MKIKIKIFTILAVAATMTLATVGSASAACNVYGKIYRAFANSSGSNDYAYVYVIQQTTVMPNFTYYFRMPEDKDAVADVIAVSAAGDIKVRIIGSASSCPTTGTWRYGGVVLQAYGYTLY